MVIRSVIVVLMSFCFLVDARAETKSTYFLFLVDNSGSMRQKHLRILDIMEEMRFHALDYDQNYTDDKVKIGLAVFTRDVKIIQFKDGLWGDYDEFVHALPKIPRRPGDEDGLNALNTIIKKYQLAKLTEQAQSVHVILLSDESRTQVVELEPTTIANELNRLKVVVHTVINIPQGCLTQNNVGTPLEDELDYRYINLENCAQDKDYFPLARITKGSVWTMNMIDQAPFIEDFGYHLAGLVTTSN